MRTLSTAIAAFLFFATATGRAAVQEEPVLFFDARADQTATTNGGTAIWSFPTNTWRWWYQNVSQANVSPNGKRVLYIYQGNLIITTPNGQNPQVLSANAAYPAWSPQGDRIAFFYGTSLRIISPSGVVLQTPVPYVFNYHPPTWSPDGKKIAFSGGITVQEVGCELFAQSCPAYRTLTTIYSVDLASGISTPLFTPTYISYEAGKFVVGGNTTFTTIISEQVKLDHPVWSPDGQRIAARKLVWRWHTYSPDVPTGWKAIEANVVTIPADGGDPTSVTTDINTSPYADATLLDSFPASWTEDGLYYIRHRGGSLPVQDQGTYVSVGSGPGTKINGFVSAGTQGTGGTHTGTLQRTTLNQSGVKIQLFVPSTSCTSGQTFDATVTIMSCEDGPQTIAFTNAVLTTDDTNVLQISSVPLPPPFILTAQAPSKTFTVPVTANKDGMAQLICTISVTDTNNLVTIQSTNRMITVGSSVGDLLIKRDSQTVFGLDDVYQKRPTGDQVRTNIAQQNVLSQFQIEIQNDDNQPRTFKLTATESVKTGWDAHYLFGAQDISAQLLTASGFEFPQLATQAIHTLTVRMMPTNTTPAPNLRTTFSLTSTNDPGAVLDSVAAVTVYGLPTLVGHTYCICNSNVISDAAVQIGTNHLKTDAAGFFVWSNVPPKTYSVTVTATNYASLSTNWVVNGTDPFQTNDYYLTNLFFVINAMLDTNIMTLANAGDISNTMASVAEAYSSYIADPLCVKILFSATDNGLGASLSHKGDISYSTYLDDLSNSTNHSAIDLAATATLNPPPYTGILSNHIVRLKAANLEVIGEQGLADEVKATDDGLNGHIWFNFSEINATRPGANTNSYDLRAVAMHEINEILGAGGGGTTLRLVDFDFDAGVGPLDLYRYSAPGVRSFSLLYYTVSYFSIDGGTNMLVHFNQAGGSSDFSDWGNGNTNADLVGNSPPQVSDAVGTPGATPDLGANEFISLDIIGYTLKANSAIQNPKYDGKSFQFEVATIPGQTYQVQSETKLSQGSWQNVGNSFVATGMTANFSNTVSPGPQFYRVVSVSPPPSPGLRSSDRLRTAAPMEIRTDIAITNRFLPRRK